MILQGRGLMFNALTSILLLLCASASLTWSFFGKQREPTVIVASQSLREAASGAAMEKVFWVEDLEWYRNESKRGCCPYPKVVYENRYRFLQYRCCGSRLDEIDPWRPLGGLRFGSAVLSRLNNAKIYLQGDSMAEQHYLALLCLAWADKLHVELKPTKHDPRQRDPTVWTARIASKDLSMQVDLNRQYSPVFDKDTNYSGDNYDFVILGGMHHGGLNNIEHLMQQVSSERQSKPIIMVNPLPSHFPGGVHRPDNDFPDAVVDPGRPTGYCDQRNGRPNPDIINNLTSWIEKFNRESQLQQVIYRIEAEHLYTDRGNAHIGLFPPGPKGVRGRDCLHYCFAPGVLDALAMETLRVLSILA